MKAQTSAIGTGRNLLVMGNAPCLMDDLSKARARLGVEYDLAAVNGAGVRVLDPIGWWASCHPCNFVSGPRWAEIRHAAGGNSDWRLITNKSEFVPDGLAQPRHLFRPRVRGSSTLLAVLAGLDRGYERVVVAGAPLDDPEYNVFRTGWQASGWTLRGRVESVSGWTANFLKSL